MYNKKFKDLIFYEIYPTSFFDSNNDGIGDLKGIEQKLTYIKDLGCNAIWINPFYVSPFYDGGYDVKDFYNIDPRFGTMEDFDSMLKRAHELNLKIIIDLVAGHASEENEDFLRSAEEVRNEKSDLFIWNDCVWHYDMPYRLISGRHQRNACFMVNFFAVQPAFNFGFNNIKNPNWQMSYKDERTFLAREYIINIIRFWLDKGVDGFRVDMADSLVKEDDDKTATIEVWKYIFSKIRKDYKDVFFVSEWSNPKQALEAGFDADFVLDHWDNFYHRLARSSAFSRGDTILKGAPLDFFMNDIKTRYEDAKEHPGYLALISGNHDTTRLATYLSKKELEVIYFLLYTLPGIPFLYYGDEIGMKHAPILSKDGGYQRTGDRTPMQWDNTLNYGFSTSKDTYLPTGVNNDVSLEEAIKDTNSIYHYIKKLILLRKEYEDLTSDDFQIDEINRIITIRRNNLEIILNLSNKEITIDRKIIFTNGKNHILNNLEVALVRK